VHTYNTIPTIQQYPSPSGQHDPVYQDVSKTDWKEDKDLDRKLRIIERQRRLQDPIADLKARKAQEHEEVREALREFANRGPGNGEPFAGATIDLKAQEILQSPSLLVPAQNQGPAMPVFAWAPEEVRNHPRFPEFAAKQYGHRTAEEWRERWKEIA
jgi:hypothetical protein